MSETTNERRAKLRANAQMPRGGDGSVTVLRGAIRVPREVAPAFLRLLELLLEAQGRNVKPEQP